MCDQANGAQGASSGNVYHFPRGFLWGAATSSHQVEGDNRWNDWWAEEQSGRLPYASGAACRHYELFQDDFDLARSWGHNAHRFSIEWSRIEPVAGMWNADAVEHYRAVLQALRERGLEPVVTLHHFTNPAWFAQRGGWLCRDSVQLFARYTDYVVTHLGADVTYWMTLNEPTVYLMQGYINGEWPPFLRFAWRQALIVCRNLARAHAAAYRVLHQRRQGVQVGFAHNALCVMPCDPTRRRDRVAATLRDWLLNDAFLQLLGWRFGHTHRCSDHLDFLGINYYSRAVIRSVGMGLGALLGRVCHLPHHPEQGPIGHTEWEVYPAGLGQVLEKFAALGVPLLISENGLATDDEALRSAFLKNHLESLAAAMQREVPVIGYLYWSLLDNFEWAMGTQARFGLAAVNFRTQERVSRPCAAFFEHVCRANSVPI